MTTCRGCLLAVCMLVCADQCAAQAYQLIGRFGDSGSGPGEFNAPTFVAIDRLTGNLVVSDTGNSRVQIFDAQGNYLTQFGAAGAGDGQFGPMTYTGDDLTSTEQVPSPAGVAIDPATGNIVVADGTNARLQIFDSAGNYVSQFQTADHLNGDAIYTAGQDDATWFPADLAIDDLTGDIVTSVSNFYWDNEYFPSCVRIGIDFGWVTTVGVQTFDSTGQYVAQFQDPNSYCNGISGYTYPRTLAVDSNLRHIVVGNVSDAVEIFNFDGVMLRWIPIAANAVAVDPRDGNIVALTGNEIEILTSTGRFVQRFATAYGTGPYPTTGVSGIAVDASTGNIVVVDPSNNRVDIFGQAAPS